MSERPAFLKARKRPWQEAYEEGISNGFSVTHVREYRNESGDHFAEMEVRTPYVQKGVDSPILGYGTVSLSGERRVGDLELYLPSNGPDPVGPTRGRNLEDVLSETGGSLDLSRVDGGFVSGLDATREMSTFMSAATTYPHVSLYPEFEDLRKPVNKRLGLPDPTPEDYRTYLDRISSQMRSGDMQFIGNITCAKDLYLAQASAPATKAEADFDRSMSEVMELD